MADKPGHMIEIPDSLGRDVDKVREGKLKGTIPVEAFMSDAALAQVEKQTREAAAPVHAESLQPISHAEALRKRTFNGETLPDFPQTRRVIPPPFQRPRINAGRHGKTWQYCSASEVQPGDLVPGVGTVETVDEQVVYATREDILGDLALSTIVDGAEVTVTREQAQVMGILDEQVAVGTAVVLTGQGGNVKALRPGDQVQVFRKAPE